MGVLDGKVAIVSGAGQGIGRGIALALAKEGAAVAVAEVNVEKGPRVAREIAEHGGRSLFVQCDVRFRDQVNKAVAATVNELGSVDILVNNVQGRYSSPLEEVTDDLLNLCWQSGPVASLYLMQACLPYFKEKRRGKIINLGSGAAIDGLVNHGAYSIVKNATLCLTRVAAREWAVHNVNVNTINPVAPELSVAPDMPPGELTSRLGRLGQSIPLGRLGGPERDIGRAAVFLASADSDFITGQVLTVDGGHHMFQ